jgi:tRNA 2-selenouridine synthase
MPLTPAPSMPSANPVPLESSALEPEAFLALEGPLLDVRSPGEFAEGHIPGAVSFPLFSDAERAEVGTLYKQQGQAPAMDRGLELVGPKLADFVRRARTLALEAGESGAPAPLRIHCWRGGMRSGSMAWLLRTAGLTVHALKGGYKAFRHYGAQLGAELPGLLTLHGPTGSGKTAILQALARMGEQVVDLEALARHRGSSFGALGQAPQPTTEQFQNDLSETLRGMDRSRRIWAEGESKSIGRCYLPDPFWERMNRAPLLELELPRAARVQRLVAEYGDFDRQALAEAVGRLRKRLGGQRHDQALEALEQGRLAEVAEALLHYYDKAYERHRVQHKARKPIFVALEADSPEAHARLLLERLSGESDLPQ